MAKFIPPYVQVEDKDGYYRFIHRYPEVACLFRWRGRATWRLVPIHELSEKLQSIAAAMLPRRSFHRAYAPWMLSRRNGGENTADLLKSKSYRPRPRKAVTPAQSRAA